MPHRSSTAARISLPAKCVHRALIVLSLASRKPARIALLPKNLENAPELLRQKAREGQIRERAPQATKRSRASALDKVLISDGYWPLGGNRGSR